MITFGSICISIIVLSMIGTIYFHCKSIDALREIRQDIPKIYEDLKYIKQKEQEIAERNRQK